MVQALNIESAKEIGAIIKSTRKTLGVTQRNLFFFRDWFTFYY